MTAIAWGITGAGVLLEESLQVIEKLLARGISVTAFVSRSAEHVLSAYGLKDRLDRALRGLYPTGIIYESREKPSFPTVGRVYLGVYSFIVVSPATLNTVAKIVWGIADSLVTNLVAHGVKAGLPVSVLPVDLYEVKSKIPVYIDRTKCASCHECSIVYECPAGALAKHPYYKVTIDLDKCTKCYKCVSSCPRSAVSFDLEISVKPVPYYVEIISKLEKIPGVRIIKHPSEVFSLLEGYI